MSRPLTSDTERSGLDTESNKLTTAPRLAVLHEWFQYQAEKTPAARAITFEGQHLTYGQLNLRANSLKCHLRSQGVGPDVPVGLCVERSLDMVVGILGILKAGGAYVPLDPHFPQARLDFMVEDSLMPVLVTHRGAADKLRNPPPVVVRLDADWNELATGDESATFPEASSNNLAYVLYTSGSTGSPKGVAVPHSALVTFLASMQCEPGFKSTDVMLAVTTLSFDIAGLELLLPLVSGGRVEIASREDAQDPSRLIRCMRESQCDVMQATPVTWRALIDAGWTGSKNLKVLCGGENLPPELAIELLPRCAQLWNMYGPTETTIWSTIHRVRSTNGAIPIGRPIMNTEVFVFDEDRNSVPTGTVGELYIGGAGLARGYLNNAELTKERFVQSPLDPRARLYRTGDLVRSLPNGTLEWVGRVDDQVKVRGFRIELGEVESVLGRHAGVKQCVVTARRESSLGDASLVAYFEPSPGISPTINDLRAHLRAQLPEYMVPSTFVSLDKLPLTPNGKVDRKALPSPDDNNVEVREGFAEPRDELEKKLVEIWSKVLKAKHVGLRDNFFDLGGHSFAGIVMLAEVRKQIGIALPLAILFEVSTVESLAEILRKDNWTPSWSSLVPIQPHGSKPPLFLVHGAEGNVLLYRQVTSYLGKEQPTYGLQSRGLSGEGIFHTSIQEMAAQYLQDIMAVQPRGPYFLGGYCLGGTIALEIAQQLRSLGEKVQIVMLLDTFNGSADSTSAIQRVLSAPLHLFQNVWFHLANIWSIPAADRRRFSGEKSDIAFARLGIRLRVAYSSMQAAIFRRGGDGDMLPGYSHLLVKKVNDQAAAYYLPKPYDAKVALIRPKGHFIGYDSPTLGWDKMINDLEVHQLSVFPKGMLIEPFCRELAATMSLYLRDA